MTDPSIIAASYAAEKNYSHNPDDIIDASDAVGAWGTAKESTTKLVDISGNNNIADIHGAMPAEGFIQGRRYDGDDNHLNCGNGSLDCGGDDFYIECIVKTSDSSALKTYVGKLTYTLHSWGLYQNLNYFSFQMRDTGLAVSIDSDSIYSNDVLYYIICARINNYLYMYINGVQQSAIAEYIGIPNTASKIFYIGKRITDNSYNVLGTILHTSFCKMNVNDINFINRFNALARLPFWSVNYTDYPDNVTEYTDNLPYSSSIISSGIFKVDDDKLQCVSAGTMTYSASYEFDGNEYIKIDIDGVEYAGTETITQGNTTVSVAQGSNKVTIVMGTGDTIEGEIGIQFRAEV